MTSWLKQQRRVTVQGVKAVLFDATLRDLIRRSPALWAPEEITLMRRLHRPSEKQVLVAMELRGLIEELGVPNLDAYDAARLRAWLDPLPRHEEPDKVFSVNFYIDGCPGMSQVWGWYAIRFSRSFHLLCEFGTFDDYPSVTELGHVPIGLIHTRDPIRSAAIVISRHPKAGCANLFEDEITCASWIQADVRSVDVFRLMLAWDCCKCAVTKTDGEFEAFGEGCCTVEEVRRLMGGLKI